MFDIKSDPLVELACVFLLALFTMGIMVMLPQPSTVPITSRCRQAQETLVLNQQELVRIAKNSNQDILTFLERNRWIIDSLKQEIVNVCKPAT